MKVDIPCLLCGFAELVALPVQIRRSSRFQKLIRNLLRAADVVNALFDQNENCFLFFICSGAPKMAKVYLTYG